MLHSLVQLLGVANFVYAIYFNTFVVELPHDFPRNQYGGQWKYLTHWNLWIQLLYFLISFVNSFVGSQAFYSAHSSRLQKIRDFFFSTVAFPIGMFVGIMFWSIYAVDREMVFPKVYDNYFPVYVNHMLHTTVIPLQVLELYLIYHVYPKRALGVFTTSLFCFSYIAWTLVVAHQSGIWVYPILELLTPIKRALFLVGCAAFGGVLNLLGEFMNNKVWSNLLPKGGKQKNK